MTQVTKESFRVYPSRPFEQKSFQPAVAVVVAKDGQMYVLFQNNGSPVTAIPAGRYVFHESTDKIPLNEILLTGEDATRFETLLNSFEGPNDAMLAVLKEINDNRIVE
jgi:hypothetical protein